MEDHDIVLGFLGFFPFFFFFLRAHFSLFQKTLASYHGEEELESH